MSPGKILPKQRIIAVMGPTGAGKSTFIDYATGQYNMAVGHGLESHTADIRSVSVTHPIDGHDHDFVFVDTPGFGDTYRSDPEVLCMVAEWLVKTYKTKNALTGIIYLHRVTDNRMSGSLLRNLELFTNICGQKVMPKVIIATTMWAEVKEEIGIRREDELKQTFWKEMLDVGCRTERFGDTQESAWHIINCLIGSVSGGNILISSEIVEAHRKLNETQAGITLTKQLEQLIKDQKEASRTFRGEAEKQTNTEVVEDLNKKRAEIDEKIIQITDQLRQLRIPFTKKVRLFFANKQRL